MATKKQKRMAGLAKREKWLAERRESGLNAQKKDHENRKNKLRETQREKHNKEHSWKHIESSCILCQDKLEESRRQSSTNKVAADG